MFYPRPVGDTLPASMPSSKQNTRECGERSPHSAFLRSNVPVAQRDWRYTARHRPKGKPVTLTSGSAPQRCGRGAVIVRLSLWAAVLTATMSALAWRPRAPASPTAAPAKPTAATGAAPAGSPAAAASQGAAASPAAGAPATGAAPAAANKPAVAPDYAFFGGKTVRILLPFAAGGRPASPLGCSPAGGGLFPEQAQFHCGKHARSRWSHRHARPHREESA